MGWRTIVRQLSATAQSAAAEVTRRIQKANVPTRRAKTRVGIPPQTWEANVRGG